MEIFSDLGGAFASRWGHVLVGITWIGLLYYFNFVQVPAFAQMEAPARINAIDKLASRALWWFRWSAAATVATGVLILYFQDQFDGDYFKSLPGISISVGMLFGLTMFANVWLVIWPNQKIVIANARNVQAGGEADPNAAPALRKAGLASRQNVIFSFTMLFFMVGTSHFFTSFHFVRLPESSDRLTFWIITLIVWIALELKCLGIIGGTGAGGLNWPYESHKNAIITASILVVGFYVLTELVFKA